MYQHHTEENVRFIGIYDYTVILTYMNLVSGLIGMGLASAGRTGAAILCLALSGFFDLFDGAVARTKKNRTEDAKGFGIQLDSLCDIVSFGVLPAWILYCAGYRGTVGCIMLILYVLCALIRLAFFNVLEAKRRQYEECSVKYFRGLPVTTAAIAFPFFYLLSYVIPHSVMNVVWAVLPLLMAFLFILDIKVPKLNASTLIERKK